MNELSYAAMLLAGGVFGSLLAAWLMRSKLVAHVEAAVSKAEMPLQTELSELRERVRSGEETRQRVQGEYDTLKRDAESWRAELDKARDDISRLAERALRVPVLEAEVERLSGDIRQNHAEIRRLSEENAQKGAGVELLATQVAGLTQEKDELQVRLERATQTATEAEKRVATLEEQASRLPALQQELIGMTNAADSLAAQFSALKESASAESARLQATREVVEQLTKDLEESRRVHAEASSKLHNLHSQLAEIRESSSGDKSRLEGALKAEQEAHALVRGELHKTKVELDADKASALKLTAELSELRVRLDEEAKAAAEKQALLLEAKETLTNQFKALANDILEEKATRFSQQNQETLGQLLAPLKTQLTEFKGKVEEVYVQEGKDRSALAEQVRHLLHLNQSLSQEAKNLTLALKGNTKTQGNWGELVLERVLEASGLRKDYEYHVQENQQREDGTRAQADVVINLPEDRRLVVDSKVSLLAYETYVNAESDEERSIQVKRHLESVRSHIKGLSAKEYQLLYGLKSLDFVLMFIPLEPAFMLAVTNDNELFMDAWNKNVLLVSPSTLLFVVRTVAHLWRQEAQSNNAQEIAKRGAELYDKLSAFVQDLEAVGTKLSQAQQAYDNAQKKLSTGRGNAIRQAEMLRELGVQPSKPLNPGLVERAAEDNNLLIMSELSSIAASNTPQGVSGFLCARPS